MYKVFIVDDESLVITSMKSCVNWEELGFSVIGEANDGISAHEMIIELKPDIVFADIRMPGMSGLELIKKVYDQNQNIFFVIISGYAEFAYVQKALSYGVLGYCLKPFDENEITFLLARAREELEKSKAILEMEFISLIYDTKDFARIQVKSILEMRGLQITQNKGIVAAVSIGLERLIIPVHINHIRLKLGGNRVAYLFQDSWYDDFKQHFQSQRNESVLRVGLSKTCFCDGAITDAIEEACISANQYFMTGKSGIYSYEDYNQKHLNSAFSQLENSIVKKDINLIQNALDMLEAELSKGVYNIKHAFQVYNMFMYSFCILNTDKYECCLYDYEQLARSFGGIHDMFRFLKGLLKEYAGIKLSSLPSSAKSDTFNSIISFVNEHYCEDMSIHIISMKFAVNPNYVSQLFKKQTGATFTEYVTSLRVNLACNLLKTTDLTVAEVADKVGFNDYYYFTRVFKKNVGETPTSFRDKNLMK